MCLFWLFEFNGSFEPNSFVNVFLVVWTGGRELVFRGITGCELRGNTGCELRGNVETEEGGISFVTSRVITIVILLPAA